MSRCHAPHDRRSDGRSATRHARVSAAQRPASGAAPTTARALALQRSAGNRATRAMLDRPVQRSGGTAAQVDYATTHTCDLRESAIIFSSWAFATAKLLQNIPALATSSVTGIHTDNLKRGLQNHFGVDPSDRAERQRVLRVLIPGYRRILAAMGGGLKSVKCGGSSCEDGDYAYVLTDGSPQIYLCEYVFRDRGMFRNPRDLGATWIHELSHQKLNTDDHGYYSVGESTTLDTDTALENGDCWGNFMMSY